MKRIFEKQLTTAEFDILRRVKANPFEFAKFINVLHPIRGKVPFDLYPFQKAVLLSFIENRFNIILKFRQAGVTELISLYCLWLAMFHENKNIIIISIKDSIAKKVLKKIKYMYKNLPDYLKVSIVNGRTVDSYGTAQEIEFATGSIIASIPTTEQAARSEALSLLVIDEAAIVRWANQIWAAAFPTLSTGGGAIVNSTPYGMGNWFHQQWQKAITGESNFVPIRLKWQMHPERDQKWYDQMSAELGPRRTAQEIDGDFLSSGNNVFDLANIREIEDSLREMEPIYQGYEGALIQWAKPEFGEKYHIGGDVSSGRSRDYSSYTIYNSRGEEVEVFRRKIEPGKFADLLMKRGKKFNYAVLAPETNDIGLAVTSRIQEQGYPKLYYSSKILRRKGKPRVEREIVPGWLTTTKNRSLIITELEEDLRLGNIVVKDPFFVAEAYTFVYDDNQRPVALGKNKKSRDSEEVLSNEGNTDDAIIGKAIANRIRKEKFRSPVAPR